LGENPVKKLALLAAAFASLAIASPALADGGLTFIIDGDTFNQPFTITNTSTAGEFVTGFGLTLVSPLIFDTVDGGPGANLSTAFAPQGGTDVTTGYTGPASFPDGSASLAFTFNDFNVGEHFSWLIDVDSGNTGTTVLGSGLVGSTGFANFSNGGRATGTFVAHGVDGAQLLITAVTPGIPEPAAWGLMIMGFGLAGAALRRRQPVAAA